MIHVNNEHYQERKGDDVAKKDRPAAEDQEEAQIHGVSRQRINTELH